MRALKNVDPDDKAANKAEKKEKRKAKRAHRKAERALNPFNQPPKNSRGNSKNSSGLFDDGLSGGGCKDGNSRKDCPEVQTTTTGKQQGFNPNKGVISNRRKVGSKRQREKQAKKDENARLKAETGKTKAGRALSKLFSKKPKPKQRRHANTRFM